MVIIKNNTDEKNVCARSVVIDKKRILLMPGTNVVDKWTDADFKANKAYIDAGFIEVVKTEDVKTDREAQELVNHANTEAVLDKVETELKKAGKKVDSKKQREKITKVSKDAEEAAKANEATVG